MEDRTWEKTQINTFTKWTNSYLKRRNLSIENLQTDLSDGTKLINLCEILSNQPFSSRWHKNPKQNFQKLENCRMAITYIEQKMAIKLVGIGGDDIWQGNLTLILGLIWSLINKYQVETIKDDDSDEFMDEQANAGTKLSAADDGQNNANQDGAGQDGQGAAQNEPKDAAAGKGKDDAKKPGKKLSGRDRLLNWAKKSTDGHKGVNITDFNKSWRGGLPFCAIIHRYIPNAVDYNNIPEDKAVEIAFNLMEEVGINVFLEQEDLMVETPDEKSVVTQVSEFYHFFRNKDNLREARAKFGNAPPPQAEEPKKEEEKPVEEQQAQDIPTNQTGNDDEGAVVMTRDLNFQPEDESAPKPYKVTPDSAGDIYIWLRDSTSHYIELDFQLCILDPAEKRYCMTEYKETHPSWLSVHKNGHRFEKWTKWPAFSLKFQEIKDKNLKIIPIVRTKRQVYLPKECSCEIVFHPDQAVDPDAPKRVYMFELPTNFKFRGERTLNDGIRFNKQMPEKFALRCLNRNSYTVFEWIRHMPVELAPRSDRWAAYNADQPSEETYKE